MRTATLPPPTLDPGEAIRPARPGPAWARPAPAVLLLGTAALHLWNLSANGSADDHYAAAVQVGTHSGKAWLSGSFHAGNAITVDKPPASLWIMTASARIFGFSAWSLLVPQALEGVAAVALPYAAVKRWAGPGAGLPAGGGSGHGGGGGAAAELVVGAGGAPRRDPDRGRGRGTGPLHLHVSRLDPADVVEIGASR